MGKLRLGKVSKITPQGYIKWEREESNPGLTPELAKVTASLSSI